MSSCLSGGGRAYRLDLEIIKSPTASWTSNSSSSSPSSTLSESRNSPLAISTRKARTPRKRPNQTYNEAAAILFSAYPKLFPIKHLIKRRNLPDCTSPFLFAPSELVEFPPPTLERANFPIALKGSNSVEKACYSPEEISSLGNPSDIREEYREDLAAESMLDEEIEEGIDSIMGNLSMENKNIQDSNSSCCMPMNKCCHGYPLGLGFDSGYGIRRELRVMRNGDDEGNWWRFPSVNVTNITQTIAKVPEQKEKKKKIEKKNSELAKESSFPTTKTKKEKSAREASCEGSIPQPIAGLLLKLNYDDVLNAWAEKGSPFYGHAPAAESPGNDVQARLAQIDLFPEETEECGGSGARVSSQRKSSTKSKKSKVINGPE